MRGAWDPDALHHRLSGLTTSAASEDAAESLRAAIVRSERDFELAALPEGGYSWQTDIIVEFLLQECGSNLETRSFVAEP